MHRAASSHICTSSVRMPLLNLEQYLDFDAYSSFEDEGTVE
jgi:hypothetical protein